MSDTSNPEPPSASGIQPTPSPSLLPDREWDKLLKLIGDGLVIPVIGPELLCVPWEGKPAARLYDLWGQALASQRRIESISGPEETPLLYRVANQLSTTPDLRPNDLAYDIDEIVGNQRWPLPDSLRLLAEIRNFPLYITTTIDHLMMAAFGEARERRQEPLPIFFKQGGKIDLPEQFVPGGRPVVFHLFGATSGDPGGFAATEDALIDFSWALLDDDYMPKRLYDLLSGKTILLLGCDFPDWLARFFIHALIRRPNAQIAVIYVSGCRPTGLHDFLRRKRARVLPPQSPVDFVAELHRRWQARQRPEQRLAIGHVPAPQECKNGAVFLSYAWEDRPAALEIRAQLEAANVDTWMDESGLEPGAEFQHEIHDNIEKASFFVAIISRALDLDRSERRGRFVLKEWKWAEDAKSERRHDDPFLQAVVVDDTPAGASFIDRPFRENVHWTRLRDGKLPPKFIDRLRGGVRRFRREPGGEHA